MKKEYAFDVKMAAVIRVQANTEAEARAAMTSVTDCMDLSEATLDGVNDTQADSVKVTEASAYQDDADGPKLFEVKEPGDDGETLWEEGMYQIGDFGDGDYSDELLAQQIVQD
jgi:hypothetical protein